MSYNVSSFISIFKYCYFFAFCSREHHSCLTKEAVASINTVSFVCYDITKGILTMWCQLGDLREGEGRGRGRRGGGGVGVGGDTRIHTPSTAFRHLPPNSARFSYATEGAFFIAAQPSSDAVSALRKVRVLI